MGYFLVYMLKSGFCLTMFYLFYRLFLSRETFFRFNRIIILGLVLFSFLIPFIHFTTENPTLIQRQALDLEALLLMANEVEIEQSSWNPYAVFLGIYLIGVFCFLLRVLFSIGRIMQIIRMRHPIRIDGVSVYLVTKEIAPFSWMNTIIMSEKDWRENGKEILTHEKAHILAGHAYDLIAINICVLFQWFNPAIWLLKQELQSLHEYQADEAVLTQGIDAKKYQLLLIKKTVGSQRFLSVANSFNQSGLKSRIRMMLKSKSNPWRKLKFVGILPFAIATIAAFARTEVSNELEKLSAAKITEIIPDGITRATDKVTETKTDSVMKKSKKKKENKKQKGNKQQQNTITTDSILAKVERDGAQELPKNLAFVVDHEHKTAEEVQSIDPKEIKRIDVLKTPSRDLITSLKIQEDQGVILVTTLRSDAPKEKRLEESQNAFYNNLNAPLILIDGEVYEDGLQNIDPSDIESVSVFKNEEAINKYKEKYGDKMKNGVVEITLKNK